MTLAHYAEVAQDAKDTDTKQILSALFSFMAASEIHSFLGTLLQPAGRSDTMAWQYIYITLNDITGASGRKHNRSYKKQDS